MNIEKFSEIIAARLSISRRSTENTLQLLEEGCTIPSSAATARNAQEVSTK